MWELLLCKWNEDAAGWEKWKLYCYWGGKIGEDCEICGDLFLSCVQKLILLKDTWATSKILWDHQPLEGWDDFRMVTVSSLMVFKKSLEKISTCLLTKRNTNEKIPTARHILVLAINFWGFLLWTKVPFSLLQLNLPSSRSMLQNFEICLLSDLVGFFPLCAFLVLYV